MTKVQELELAVKSLPPKDLRQFRDWFASYDEKNWDSQIIKDQKNENSPIAKLARRALIAHRQGKSTPL
jgi:hypothetical protein